MMPVAKPFGLGQIAAPRTTWRGVTGLVTDALTVFPGGHNFATRYVGQAGPCSLLVRSQNRR
jgi:hypothetical protein